jgi:hypothetical protein
MLIRLINRIKVFNNTFFINLETAKYIKFNKSLFKQTSKESSGIILVDFWNWNPMVFFWSILANYIAKKNKLQIRYFYFPFYNMRSEKYLFFKRKLKKIYYSFNCKFGFTTSGKSLDQKQKLKFIAKFKKFKNKDQLRKYKFKNILIGDLIYDTVIRTYQIPTIDLIDARLLNKFLEAHLIFLKVEKYLNKNDVKFLIASDCVYNQFGIISRICNKKKIKTLYLHYFGRGMYNFKLSTYDKKINSFKNPYYRYKKIFKSLNPLQQKKGLRIGKDLLIKRIGGDVKSGTPYLDKSPYNSNLIEKKDKFFNKKNYQTLLLLHNFFDAPHKYRNFIYSDYLEWALETIKILEKKKVKTYIKFHPMIIDKIADKEAKEDIMKIVRNNKNFKIINPKTSYKSLINNGLNSAITCHGTAACELSYFNINVINCGDNPHINYNFCTHTKSKREYINKISLIENQTININKSEIYEYFYMQYYHFDHKDYKNKFEENFITKKFYNKSNEYKINFHNSSKYFNYIINLQKKKNIKKKLENYFSEYLSKNRIA